jgi:hypothetical protein
LRGIILKRLNTFVSTQNVLPNHQFGFRAAHSTSHQLNRVVRHVKNKWGQSTGMLILVVKKAFASVWDDAFLHKLIQGGCNIFQARIIHSFLSGRTSQVSVSKFKSSVCNISYGVPQGAYLSPILYNLFTSDALTADGCKPATFADDTAIFVFNSEPMNVCDELQSQIYFKKCKIKVNTSKTQAIYSTRCWSPRKFLTLELYLTAKKCHGLRRSNTCE